MLYRNKQTGLIVEASDLLRDLERAALVKWEDDRSDLVEHFHDYESYLAQFKPEYFEGFEEVREH